MSFDTFLLSLSLSRDIYEVLPEFDKGLLTRLFLVREQVSRRHPGIYRATIMSDIDWEKAAEATGDQKEDFRNLHYFCAANKLYTGS